MKIFSFSTLLGLYILVATAFAQEPMQSFEPSDSMFLMQQREPQPELTMYEIDDENVADLAKTYSYDATTANLMIKSYRMEQAMKRGMQAIEDVISQCPAVIDILKKHKFSYRYADGRRVGYEK